MGQTHHWNKRDGLTVSKYESKGQRMIFYEEKYVHILIVLLTFAQNTSPVSMNSCKINSGVLGSIPGLATYFPFSFRFFKKGSCQLLAKVCARSTGQSLRRSKPAQEKCG